ncbi:ABC transporter substrate-binding protein [Halomonas daqiaonensis]|uniref:Iron(III) transport system substrate-binding protein n=1 Tax=Halomonas daqiaonensis TaxID=650850 RepID=A0A1H7H9N4_9GAMM|nr:ABC transporter substrate-binding protein [Halomonas daqiaonensis]SEK46022.1 iron(III) transport system substrate-binding protein [Halomonas daqiaonensis]
MNRRSRLVSRWLLLIALVATVVGADETLHYPATSGDGPRSSLVIHGALDLPQMRPLLEGFQRQNPGLAVRYRNLTTLELHERFLAAPDEADVLLSSAMPWQYRLANAGHAGSLESPAAQRWPGWARWRRELFAITFEPIVMVVNEAIIERFGEVRSHADLLALLERHAGALQGQVVTYDPASSGAGYTYAIEESRLSPRYWDLVAALGQAETELVDTTGEMLEGLIEGRYLVGYNLLGSYATARLVDQPQLRIVVPEDYTLVTQRLALIPRQAPHPEAAERFLDYLISETGQGVLARETTLGAIHPALDGPGTATLLRQERGEALRPITLGPSLLATLDDLKREALLTRWQREFTP